MLQRGLRRLWLLFVDGARSGTWLHVVIVAVDTEPVVVGVMGKALELQVVLVMALHPRVLRASTAAAAAAAAKELVRRVLVNALGPGFDTLPDHGPADFSQ